MIRPKQHCVYLLLEFQSTVDRFMAVRIHTYVGLLYQDLIKSGRIGGHLLPPVLPVVVYNGGSRWNAPTSLGGLVRTERSATKRVRADARYELINVRGVRLNTPSLKRNLAAAMFRIENTRERREVCDRLVSLLSMLTRASDASLRHAFSVWISQVVFAHMRGVRRQKTMSLEEVNSMLSDRWAQWEVELRAEGRREGVQQGIREGARDGRLGLLLAQLHDRFGHELPARVRQQLQRASTAQLTRWGRRLLHAETLLELFPTRRRRGTKSRTPLRASARAKAIGSSAN